MRWIFMCFFLMACLLVKSQNLIPNPSFETYWECPTNNGNLGVSNWYRISTPDYMNTCASLSFFTVPTSLLGNQEPKDGNAYMGMFFYQQPFGESREYIIAPLSQLLTARQYYYVSFFVSLTETSQYAVNNIGAAFTNYRPTNYDSTLAPQINSVQVISDKENWTKVSGLYQATGGESYLTIGRFYPNTQTSIVPLPAPGQYAYYFVDSITVSSYSTVPIELKKFICVSLGVNTVKLIWSSGDEINAEKYIVENSKNGIDFTCIATVHAKGSNNNYEYICQQVYGTAFYRIKMVDNNGNFKYSQICSTKQGEKNFFVNVFPNPTHDDVILQVINDRKIEMVELLSVDGKVLTTIKGYVSGQRISIGDFAKGNYILKIIFENGAIDHVRLCKI